MTVERIYILESSLHHEVMDSLIRMSRALGISVHCICSTVCKSYSDYQHSELVRWYDLSQPSTFNLIRNQLVLVSSLNPALRKTTTFLENNKVAAYIHNLHNFTQNQDYKVPGLKSFYWDLRDRLNGGRLNYFLPFIDLVLLPYEAKINVASEYLPFVFPDKDSPSPNFNQVHFSIPGVINDDRREYKLLYPILRSLNADGIRVKCTLLGKLFDKKTKVVLDKMVTAFNHVDLVYHEDYLTQAIYNQALEDSHFLFLPIKEKIRYKNFYEVRGKSCVSGNINDMVKYGIPAILPSYYPLENALESMVARYNSSDELTHLLNCWIKDRAFQKKKKNAEKAMEIFKLSVLNRYENVLTRLSQI